MTDEQQNPTPAEPTPPTTPPPASAPPAPAAGTVTKADIEKNKTWAIISYLGLLGVIIALVCEGKDSPYVKFHLNQSLGLVIATFVAFVVAMIPFLGWILALLIWLVIFIFVVMGIINASQGELKRLPIIGNLDLIK